MLEAVVNGQQKFLAFLQKHSIDKNMQVLEEEVDSRECELDISKRRLAYLNGTLKKRAKIEK